jgi:tetratricopeptide (TPR) repeat protein
MGHDLTSVVGPTSAVGLTSAVGPLSAIELAEAALAARDHDRDRAAELAGTALTVARRTHDDRAASVASRALALVALDRGRPAIAARRAEDAVRLARRSADAATVSGALTTAAGVRFLRGDASGALAALDESIPLADPTARVDALSQRAWILFRVGRWAETLELHDRLLRDPAAAPEQRAGVLHNHGCVLALLGRYDEALEAFDDALVVLRTRPADQDLLDVLHNRALCLADSGRLAESFDAFAEVEARLRDEPVDRAWLLVAQTDALLRANLVPEAVAVARRAADAVGSRGPMDLRAEAWSRVARAAHRSGDRAGSLVAARRARALFEAMGNQAQAAQSHHDELTSAARRTPAVLAQLERVVERLRRAGRVEAALLARVDALDLALELGDVVTAARLRRRIAAGRPRATALARARAWLAEARWATAQGNARRARVAVAAGLDTIDEHRALLGSTELRAQAAGLGAELAAVGLAAALGSGRPSAVVAMAERWRAGTVLRRPVVDGQLAESLAELRQMDAPGTAGASVEERRRVEHRIRRLARAAQGAPDERIAVATLGSIRAALTATAARSPAGRPASGDRALLEIVEHRGRYTGVVVDRAGGRLVALGSVAEVAGALGDLHFALRRLARQGASTGILGAARAAADDALQRLASALVAPVGWLGAHLVVVPPGALHAVPWTSLPGLVEHTDVTVAPSATWWLHASARSPVAAAGPSPSPADPLASVTLVAGPRLAGAAAEISALQLCYPGAIVFDPAAAFERAVLPALDGVGLAHLACHAHLRADHPHLSALELADGPLTVYDLERLQHAPQHVVLSACDSGVSSTRPGDELLGFLTALFSLGTRSVVASVVPVADVATAPLMLALHDELQRGASVPAALRAARLAVDLDEPASFAAAVAFVTFGTE